MLTLINDNVFPRHGQVLTISRQLVYATWLSASGRSAATSKIVKLSLDRANIFRAAFKQELYHGRIAAP
jgi:hypothetical protein